MVQVGRFPHRPQTYLEVGTTAESEDPYPRPPDPMFDFSEIRERVENWKATVLPTPLPQADNKGAELCQPIPVGDVRQPSQLDFPTVKQRRSDVVKTTKRKNSPPHKGHSTSRYFRAVAAPKSPDAANRDTDLTTSPSQPQGLNVDTVLHSPTEALDEDSVIARKPSQTTVKAADRGHIQQVSEVWQTFATCRALVAHDCLAISATLVPVVPSYLHTTSTSYRKRHSSSTYQTSGDSTKRRLGFLTVAPTVPTLTSY
jgi:hypothetical protein